MSKTSKTPRNRKLEAKGSPIFQAFVRGLESTEPIKSLLNDSGGKRGRKPAPGLLKHNKSGQWYRRYNGKEKYFGTDEAEAYKRWLAYETILATGEPQKWHIMDVLSRPKGAALLAEAAQTEEGRQRIAKNFEGVQLPTGIQSPTADQFPHVTVQDVIDVYLADIKVDCGVHHHNDAKRRLRHWTKFIGKKTDIKTITPDDFRKYRNGLVKKYNQRVEWEKKQPRPIPFADVKDKDGKIIRQGKRTAPGMAGSVVNKYLVLIKGSFNRAAERKGIYLNDHLRCLRQLEQVKAGRQEVVRLDASMLKTILTAQDEKKNDVFDIKWKSMVLFGLNIAGSNIDVAEATWHCIFWDDNFIDYRREKNDHIRRFPLWKQTRESLLAWKEICSSVDYMFTSTHGRPFIAVSKKGYRKDSLGQQFRIRMNKLKLTQSWNTIRKTVATLAAESGASEITVNMILGNASDEVWQHYVQALPEQITKAMTFVAERLGIEL